MRHAHCIITHNHGTVMIKSTDASNRTGPRRRAWMGLLAGVSLMAMGTTPALAQGEFAVDVTDPNVQVDLSVLDDGGLGPRMAVPTPAATTATAAPAASDGGYRTPGPKAPVSTLYIQPEGNFSLPPQTKALIAEQKPEPTIAPEPPIETVQAAPVQAAETPAAPEPVDIPEPPAETLAAPEPVSTPAPVAEAAPAPEPAPQEEVAKAEPAPAPEPAAESAAATTPPPPAPEVSLPAQEEPAPTEPVKTEPIQAEPPQPAPAETAAAPDDMPPPPPQALSSAEAAPESPASEQAAPTPPADLSAAAQPTSSAAAPPPAAPSTKVTVDLPPKLATPDQPGVAALPPATDGIGEQDGVRIVFEADSSKLPADARDALATLAKRLESDDTLRLQLLAYAGDADTSASAARRLSLSRALAVRSYLIENGVRSTRIDVRALGNKSTDAVTERVDVNVMER